MSYHSNLAYKAAKRCTFEALRFGGGSLFRYLNRKAVLVLIFHDVLPEGFPRDNPLFGLTLTPEEFDGQMEYVQRHYKPISLTQFVDWRLGKGEIPDRSALITFDDGHRNNLVYAGPILKKRGIPAVSFVVSGHIGTTQMTWIEEAYARLMWSNGTRYLTLSGREYKLDFNHQRSLASGEFFSLCRTMSRPEQAGEFESLRAQLPLDLARVPYRERFEFLRPEDFAALRDNHIDVGAHTVTHPILSTLSDEDACAEIGDSKRALEELIDAPVRAFAYPFGDPAADFTERSVELVGKHNFDVALTSGPGLAKSTDPKYRLPRIGVGAWPTAVLVAHTSGFATALRRAGF